MFADSFELKSNSYETLFPCWSSFPKMAEIGQKMTEIGQFFLRGSNGAKDEVKMPEFQRVGVMDS